MRRPMQSVIALLSLAAATGAFAQTSEMNGRVLEADGKPVPGAEVSITNEPLSRSYKGTSDKKGAFFISGILTAQQSPIWKIAIHAEGFVPVKADMVVRDANKVLLSQDAPKLSAKVAAVPVRLRDLSTVKIDFTVRAATPDDEAAAAPVPAAGATAPEVVAPPKDTLGLPAAPAAAASQAPDDYALAIEKVRSGDPEGSVDLFKKAIEAKPDDWERRDLYAKVLLRLDRQGEATIQANKAAAAAPDKAAPLVTLSEIYLARGLTDKAADAIAKAEKLEPDNLKVLERAASVAAQAGKLDEALALNERVLAKKPDSTEALIGMADIYNRQKQPKKAQEMLDKVVTIDPKNAYKTFYQVGAVIASRDDLSDSDNRKAIEAFRKAIDLKPDYASAHRELGFALLRSGQKPDLIEARKELQKYVDLDPKARDAADIKATIKSLESGK